MNLLHGDCLEKLKDLSKNSVDIIIADLPYGRFKHLEWDKKIDFEKLWEQLWRVSKPNTPIFLFGDFKFAVEIYNSQPKYFKYEIVWNKKTTTTPLMSRKRFGKCTEYILIFYKKQPVYNYLKYHKIIKKHKKQQDMKGVVEWKNIPFKDKKILKYNGYEPTLPINVIDEKREYKRINNVVEWKGTNKNCNTYDPKLPLNIIDCSNEIITKWIMKDGGKYNTFGNTYNPKLPTNIIEEENEEENEVVFSPMVMGKNNKMYHSKTGKYEPRLPINIISNDTAMGADWCGGKCKRSLEVYTPRLPCNVIECNTKKNKKTIKKLTEKPQFILEHLLKYFSNEGDTCLDFCMGSGSMGVACNTLNRKFIGIEKNKEFYEITKERLSSLSSSE